MSEIAILTRTNKELEIYAQKLKAKNIPYELKDGASIFKIQSTNIVYNYLKFLSNQALNNSYLMRLFLFEPFKINPKDYETLWRERKLNNDELFVEDIEKILETKDIKDKKSLEKFVEVYKELSKYWNVRSSISEKFLINDSWKMSDSYSKNMILH